MKIFLFLAIWAAASGFGVLVIAGVALLRGDYGWAVALGAGAVWSAVMSWFCIRRYEVTR